MKKTFEKSFGILFFIVFFLIGVWPLLNSGSVRIWFLVVSLIFLAIAFLKQEVLKLSNNTWIKFGELLRQIISPIVMVLIFFFIVTPLSVIIRIFGKDLLKLKFSKKNSYWIKRVIILALFGMLIVLTQGTAVTPFIYNIF